MDFNATIDLIIRELEEAREIIDDLKKHPGVPALQIELAKSKCKNAAEVIALLKQVQNSEPVLEENEKVVTEHRIEPKKQSHVEPPVTEPEKRPDKKKQLPPEPVKKHEDPEPATDENSIADEDLKKPYVAPIIADTFSHLANRFNEQIGESQGDDFSYTHGRHYENLSEAIGVNDRFYYVREIFDGKRDLYNEAIARLDKAGSLKEAREILADYKTERTSAEAVKQLLDLTRRKLGMHE